LLVHDPFHGQKAALTALLQYRFWRDFKHLGSIGWWTWVLKKKNVDRKVENYHACQEFLHHELLSGYIRGLMEKDGFWEKVKSALQHCEATATPADQALALAQRLEKAGADLFWRYIHPDGDMAAGEWTASLLWSLLLSRDMAEAIHAGHTEALTRLSRMLIPFFAASSCKNYVREEVWLQATLLTAPAHFARALEHIRIASSTGDIDSGKGVGMLWEEAIKVLKGLGGDLGGDALRSKLRLCSAILPQLLSTVEDMESFIDQWEGWNPPQPATSPSPGGTEPRAPHISGAEVRREKEIRGITDLIHKHRLLEPGAQPAWMSRPSSARAQPPKPGNPTTEASTHDGAQNEEGDSKPNGKTKQKSEHILRRGLNQVLHMAPTLVSMLENGHVEVGGMENDEADANDGGVGASAEDEE
jgi:hypothetical protein